MSNLSRRGFIGAVGAVGALGIVGGAGGSAFAQEAASPELVRNPILSVLKLIESALTINFSFITVPSIVPIR